MKLNHITNPQSDQGGDQRISIDASRLNQGGGGETDFRDKSAVKDGRPSQSQIADRCESFVITELTALCTMSSMISYDPVSYRKICNGS